MKKRVIDLAAALICLAVLGIAWLYPDQVRGREMIMWGSGMTAGCFLLMYVLDRKPASETGAAGRHSTGLLSEPSVITELVLLSEEDGTLMTWELYGKTAAVIGRDVKENQVDIDLSRGPYASMVDVEHAVLNFTANHWYVEDLGSVNGTSVKKAEDGRLYRLSSNTPCQLERGDCLYVGLNRLLLR